MNSDYSFLSVQKHGKIQYVVLRFLLIAFSFLGFLVLFLGIFMGYEPLATLISIVFIIFCPTCFILLNKVQHPLYIKIIFILFLDFIYFPVAWMTSINAFKIMPYSSILFLVITFLLVEYRSEFILPTLFLIYAVILMYIKVRWPLSFTLTYDSPSSYILTFLRYFVVILLVLVIVYMLISNYFEVTRSYDRKSIYDELTGLFNRSYGLKQLQGLYETQNDQLDKHTLIIIELEHFKAFNQKNGVLAGDTFIKTLAHLVKNNTRSNDLCFRYGGNTFLLLLNHTDLSQVNIFLLRIQNAFEELLTHYEKSDLSLLVGKANFDYNNLTEVIKAAELDLSLHRTNA
ncbi:GGDEF domain-containing protein [Petrocella sp. FN5]|uniref:GGDEF domain-containing protein n=1 Tax=Petrocella sp. FN5 TaxID=3032002 RepID=UPI0023DA17B9|nr:diguanylate cyclase [Petrocella sp. FN5]MDF1616528.1 diguanylate cyclase [Petrocella sp. FN5]